MNPSRLTRRTFFRNTTLGVGGLYLAPFIRQLEAATTHKIIPARVVFFVQGNGVYPNEVQPPGIPRDHEPSELKDMPLTGQELPLGLSPLQPHLDRLTLLYGLSGRIARGSHNTGYAALGCWPKNASTFGETIDAGIARNLGGIYEHVGLGVSNKPGSLAYLLSSAGKGKALPTILDPILAHQRFFAAGAAGDARKAFEVDTNLLDFMADDVKRMQVRLDGSEREKLDHYLDAFESMSDRQGKLATMDERIARAAPQLDPKIGIVPEKSQTAPTGIFDRLEAQFDIAAGTLIAGLTNVVTISGGAGPDKIGLDCMGSEIGAKENSYIGSHGIGHGGSAAGMSAGDCHAYIRRKCLEKVSRLIAKLEAVPEGDGTMMDNTLIVYMSDAADSHHPGCREWPMVLIGDLGGRLKLGNRYLHYPFYGKPGHRTTANFYLSLLGALGDRRETFGVADPALADLDQNGPLAELMIS